VLVISGMMFLIIRQLSLQHHRLDMAVNNMTHSLLMFDSSHRLIVCNQRYREFNREFCAFGHLKAVSSAKNRCAAGAS
jgi:hypothetical protein